MANRLSQDQEQLVQDITLKHWFNFFAYVYILHRAFHPLTASLPRVTTSMIQSMRECVSYPIPCLRHHAAALMLL